MMLVRMNHRELTTESNSTRLSIIRFWVGHIKLVRLDAAGRAVAHLVALFKKHLVVLAESDAEYD